MDFDRDLGERVREAACVGELESLKSLVETKRIDVNDQNTMNGWTALHWGAKRNHVTVVKYLLEEDADKTIRTFDGQLAENLTSNKEIRQLLGATGEPSPIQCGLPIAPNYLQNPPFPHLKKDPTPGINMSATPVVVNHTGQDDNELVLRVRLANADERDFLEVELDKSSLTYEALLNLMCAELGVERRLVYKIRKLPDTVVRKDKDVQRLVPFQSLELVLTNKAISATSRTYSGATAIRSEQILY